MGGKMEKILFIDSDGALLDLWCEAFFELGFEAIGALDCDEASRIFDKEYPDLVVLNKSFLGVGGAEFLEKIQEKDRRPRWTIHTDDPGSESGGLLISGVEGARMRLSDISKLKERINSARKKKSEAK
jgi:CheY-like chemotaxis protein